MFNTPGFTKAYNFPGSAGGETNGQYAAVTTNDIVPVDDSYNYDNTPDVFAGVNDFIDAVRGVASTATSIQQQVDAAKLNDAVTKKKIALATNPTIADQFNQQDFWTKMMVILGIGGFVYLFAKR